MPRSELGQLITFAVEIDGDARYQKYIWVDVKKGDTVQKIASRRGHPEQAREIADLNGIRSVRSVLKRKRLRVPGTLRQADAFHVLAGNEAPRVLEGYAKFDVIDRYGRVGISHFTGYDPVVLEVPIQFESFVAGAGLSNEAAIRLLERMAGRGDFAGAAHGPPPVIRVSVTDNSGNIVPLIPHNYQWSKQNPSAPTWRVANIDWEGGSLRHIAGNRLRQGAVVTLIQRTRAQLVVRSATQRAKARKPKPKKPTATSKKR